jgi:glycosyltransferase involved in cell wall biosynthesis
MTVFSIITAAYNSEKTIADTIRSIQAQKLVKIEHIVVDGGSADGTMDIVHRNRDSIAHVISEPDKGIYDAMNKGLRLATGEFVGCLNSDDYFADEHSVSKLAVALNKSGADCAWGSVLQVDSSYRPTRKVSGRWFSPAMLGYGLMPPHPAFYVRRDILKMAGFFDTELQIAGDFDLMIRLFAERAIRSEHIDDVVTIMRLGGVSTDGMAATRRVTDEIRKSLLANSMEYSAIKVNLRYLVKIAEMAAGHFIRLGGKRFPPLAPVTLPASGQ